MAHPSPKQQIGKLSHVEARRPMPTHAPPQQAHHNSVSHTQAPSSPDAAHSPQGTMAHHNSVSHTQAPRPASFTPATRPYTQPAHNGQVGTVTFLDGNRPYSPGQRNGQVGGVTYLGGVRPVYSKGGVTVFNQPIGDPLRPSTPVGPDRLLGNQFDPLTNPDGSTIDLLPGGPDFPQLSFPED